MKDAESAVSGLESRLDALIALQERLCTAVEAIAQISMIQMDQSLSGDEEENGPDVPSPL